MMENSIAVEPISPVHRRLLVVVRGWANATDPGVRRYGSGEIPRAFLDQLREEYKEHSDSLEVVVPDLPMGMFSTAEPFEICSRIKAYITEHFERDPFDDLILLGYSSGALLARGVFCLAHGGRPDGTVNLGSRAPWANRLSRLVMLAGITRGWELSTATPHLERFFAPMTLGLVRLVCRLRGGQPLILQFRRGAPFVVTLRMLYSQILRNHCDPVPRTIFLLGTRDQFISPADSMDLGPRPEFSFLEIPGSSHQSILDIHSNDANARERASRLLFALTATAEELDGASVPQGDIDDYLDPLDRPAADRDNNDGLGVEKAVFVVHGIRDNGFWTKRIARRVKEAGREAKIEVRAPSPSYGFFSMWDFLWPSRRLAATQWLLENYADVRCSFPNADISYVGHSNGTYIAAHALRICPAVRFENMAFAGSVVRRDYPWSSLSRRVGRVLNYTASADWVLAMVPDFVERIGLRVLNVGGAGLRGFGSSVSVEQARSCKDQGTPCVGEVLVRGGHSAAIGEVFWDEIADFVVNGKWPDEEGREHSDRFADSLSPFLFVYPCLLVVGSLGFVGLLFLLTQLSSGWAVGLSFVGLIGFVRTFVNFY